MTEDTTAPLLIDDDLLAAGFISMPRRIYRDASLTRDARFLYGALLDFAWEAERPCWPGYTRLMAYLGCGRTQLAKYLRELQTTGYLSVTRRGQGMTNLYTLHGQPVVPKPNIKKRSRPESERLAVPRANGEVTLEELEGVWLRALERLRPTMNTANFITWLDGVQLVALTPPWAMLLAAPHQQQGLERLERQLCRALSEASGQPITRCRLAP